MVTPLPPRSAAPGGSWSSSRAARRNTSLLARVRSRRQQRGATVLIVFLVITMLTGIGLFAARSATLATSVAGSSKQLAQTHRIAEYAAVNAVAYSGYQGQAIKVQMPRYTPVPNDPICQCTDVANQGCVILGANELGPQAGGPMVIPGDVANAVPGGLGPATVDYDFIVALTEGTRGIPIAGDPMNAQSNSPLSRMSVTLTATGQIRPLSTPANLQQNLLTSGSNQVWRAHVRIGPL